MKLEELKDEEMYVLVAPDGTAQLSTMASEYAMCLGFCELMAQKKICESPAVLFKKGFEILRVKVNMSQMGDAEAAFQAAKKKFR